MDDTETELARLKAEMETAHDAYKVAAAEWRIAKSHYESAQVALFKFRRGDVIKAESGALATVTHVHPWFGIGFSAAMHRRDGSVGGRQSPHWSDVWRHATLHHRPDAGEKT